MDGIEFLGIEEELTENTLKQVQKLVDEDILNEKTDENNKEKADLSSNSPLKPTIVNMVACVDYGIPLNLSKIATSIRNAEYNPIRFPAVTIRITDPKATGLTFKNGKVNIVGCKTEETSFLAAKKLGRLFKNLNFSPILKSFKISNIVATMDCKFPIHLESLASHSGHKFLSTYNPEIFAGLIYRLATPKVTILIFVSGKLVVTGAKRYEDLQAAADYMFPILLQFARKIN